MATKKKQPDKKEPPRRLALTNATVVDFPSGPRIRPCTVVLEGGEIAEVTSAAPAGAEVLDCGGGLLMPGFVCAHTHLYSSLARGMPAPLEAPLNFMQILERVWWKLDRALDAATLEASALIGALEALKSGTTTLIDHHASPTFIDGSLDVIAGALERVGARGVLCYEVTDRGGAAEAKAGLRENDRFLGSLQEQPRPLVRGMVGAHAAFTLSDGTAEQLAAIAQHRGAGVHIHLAEDSVDAKKDGWPTLEWLRRRGLLGSRSLLAHAVHVSDTDAQRILEADAHVVHNPRSNLNNRVGYARPSRFGARLLLGTDGIGADMRAESQAAFLAGREFGDHFDLAAALQRNHAFAAFSFGNGLGRLEPGAPADLVLLDYRAPTPLDSGNFAGHLMFGLPSAPVRHVFVGGEQVLRNGASTRIDEEAVYAQARQSAARLWSRMR